MENERDAASLFAELGMKVVFEEFVDGGHEIKEPEGYDAIVAKMNPLL